MTGKLLEGDLYHFQPHEQMQARYPSDEFQPDSEFVEIYTPSGIVVVSAESCRANGVGFQDIFNIQMALGEKLGRLLNESFSRTNIQRKLQNSERRIENSDIEQ
jgi:hypothetical protein